MRHGDIIKLQLPNDETETDADGTTHCVVVNPPEETPTHLITLQRFDPASGQLLPHPETFIIEIMKEWIVDE